MMRLFLDGIKLELASICSKNIKLFPPEQLFLFQLSLFLV